MPRQLLPAGVLLVCAVAISAADEKPAAKVDPSAVRQLVEQLKSDDFQTREKATRELSMRDKVPNELRAATKSDDLEQRSRAESAVVAITDRSEDKAFKAMAADLKKVEVDRFVTRMVTDADFGGDEQWEVVQTLAIALEKWANELSNKKFPIPNLDIKSLALQKNDSGRNLHDGKRILLSDPKARMVAVTGCVILSAAPTPTMTTLSNSIVIVDGDFQGAWVIDNCLLIVRGNVGPITAVKGSIIIATGKFKRATTSINCFYQVDNTQLLFTIASDNVYVKSTPELELAENDKNSRVLNTARGPLQLLKFSDIKKSEAPKLDKP